MYKLKHTLLDEIINAIANRGYIVLNNIIPDKLLTELTTRVKNLDSHTLKPAAIGRADSQQLNTAIRRDKINWLDNTNRTDKAFLELMDALRTAINQSIYLGLFDYEAHYAVYQPGDFYKKHIDALKGKSNRVLSTVLYLNEQWQDKDAGELLLYSDDGKNIIETVTPHNGTMVIFLSEQFPHEVLAARKTRYSIAGWFRLNASSSKTIDPAV